MCVRVLHLFTVISSTTCACVHPCWQAKLLSTVEPLLQDEYSVRRYTVVSDTVGGGSIRKRRRVDGGSGAAAAAPDGVRVQFKREVFDPNDPTPFPDVARRVDADRVVPCVRTLHRCLAAPTQHF
jgi:hypothetical protein